MSSTAAMLAWEYSAAPLCRSVLHPDPAHPVLWANSKLWNCETEWTTWILISLIVQIPSAGSPLPRSGFGNLWQMRQTSFKQHLARQLCTKEYCSFLPTNSLETSGTLCYCSPCSSTQGSNFSLSVVTQAAPPASVGHAALHTAWGFHPAAKCTPCLGMYCSVVHLFSWIALGIKGHHTSHAPAIAVISLDIWVWNLCQTEIKCSKRGQKQEQIGNS